jgi:hypothetical protein
VDKAGFQFCAQMGRFSTVVDSKMNPEVRLVNYYTFLSRYDAGSKEFL